MNRKVDDLLAEVGDTAFTLDLQSNVLTTAQFIFEYKEKHLSTKYINIYLIEVGSFYELFFKYKLSLINKSLIWQYPEKYDKEKHDNAEMKTISADIAIAYAFNFGWINENEKKIIIDFKELRNKLIHFSACEQCENQNVIRMQIIKNKDMQAHLKLIKKLLNDNVTIFKDNYIFQVITQEKTYMEI